MAVAPTASSGPLSARRLLPAAVVLGVALRLVLLAYPPLFVTDVSYYNTQAVAHLLNGVDPYGAAYSVPAPLATAGAANVFAYLPGVFPLLIAGYPTWGAALGLVLADVAIALALLLLHPLRGRISAALFLLLPPTVLFSTSFLNDGLPGLAFLMFAIVLEARGKPIASGVLWGLAFASSQEAWLLFPIFAAHCLRGRRLRELAVSAATAGTVFAPFLAWGPSAFIQNTVLFQFQRGSLPLLSQGPFGPNLNLSLQGVATSLGTSVPLLIRVALAVAILAACVRVAKPSLRSLTLVSALFSATGILILAGNFYWSYLELPLALLLGWFALGPRPAAESEPLNA